MLACCHIVSLTDDTSSALRMSSFDKPIKVRMGLHYKRKFQGNIGTAKNAFACSGELTHWGKMLNKCG